MNASDFVDYYELMQLSPNADTDTIERIFRHFAKKYHPDNTECTDNTRFHEIVEAHRILTDPESRAGYDVKYQEFWNRKWRLASESNDSSTFSEDQTTRERLLSLLYVQRRREINNPGMGNDEMARLILVPHDLVEFHLWYLKAKGWVDRLQSGQLAITATGVDQVEKNRLRLMPDHLLETHYPANEDAEEKKNSRRDEELLDLE